MYICVCVCVTVVLLLYNHIFKSGRETEKGVHVCVSIYYQLCLDQSNLEVLIELFCGAAAICTADQYYSCTTDLCTHRESHYLVITL